MTGEHDSPTRRHLALVPSRNRFPLSYPQIADMPGAYAVRRGGPPEAVIHRSNAGDWYVLYGFDGTDPDTWHYTAVLPGRLNDAEAAGRAADLVDAVDQVAELSLRVRAVYPELLAQAFAAGGALPDLVRLHHPDRHECCAGDGVEVDDRIEWRSCATVRVLAGSLGVKID